MRSEQEAQTVAGAVQAIRSAEDLLMAQMNAASNPLSAIKLTQAYQHLDSLLSQIAQLQNTADDHVFAVAVTSIKAQTSALQSDEHAIQGLIGDAQTAAKVVTCICQALGFIAKLC